MPHTPVLATEVGAGEPQSLAQDVAQVRPGRHGDGGLGAVDGEGHLGGLVRCDAGDGRGDSPALGVGTCG